MHTQPDKADALQWLTEQFLARPVSADTGPQSDVHWALLSLLAHLSQRPLHRPYEFTNPLSNQADSDFERAQGTPAKKKSIII